MKHHFKSIHKCTEALTWALAKALLEHLDTLIHHLFEVEKGQLKHIPNFVIFLIYVLCLSVLFQAGLDMVIESLMLLGFIEKIPLRVDFIFLTILSTIMGIQTLKGMAQRKLDVTRNSILIGIIVEFALIVGDLVLIFQQSDKLSILPSIRLPFLMLTFMNFFILIYVAHRLKVFRNPYGKLNFF
jgi:hypothetical protein